jgi:hypothetical protein
MYSHLNYLYRMYLCILRPIQSDAPDFMSTIQKLRHVKTNEPPVTDPK